jgi:hypothetical protein
MPIKFEVDVDEQHEREKKENHSFRPLPIPQPAPSFLEPRSLDTEIYEDLPGQNTPVWLVIIILLVVAVGAYFMWPEHKEVKEPVQTEQEY